MSPSGLCTCTCSRALTMQHQFWPATNQLCRNKSAFTRRKNINNWCISKELQCYQERPPRYICVTYKSSLSQSLNGIDFDLTGSLEMKYDGGVGLYVFHDFLFRFNSNTLPNSLSLQTTSLWNLNEPDFNLLRSFNVKCNFAVNFLLMSNSKHVYLSLFSCYRHCENLLSLGQNFEIESIQTEGFHQK